MTDFTDVRNSAICNATGGARRISLTGLGNHIGIAAISEGQVGSAAYNYFRNNDTILGTSAQVVDNVSFLDSTVHNLSLNAVEKTDRNHNLGNELYWVHWPGVSRKDQLFVEQPDNYTLNVWVREFVDSRPVLLRVTMDCVRGVCCCNHYIGGRRAQLLPCRVFVELFMQVDIDPDWYFLLWGFLFGFRVVNPSCSSQYLPPKGTKKSLWELNFIRKHFLSELDQDRVSYVSSTPNCIHDVFVVPKDGGGGRVVVDCSRPKEFSVNNSTDEVKMKFSYKSLGNVTDMLQKGDYIGTLDIKDAYRAVNIHPSDRQFQGLRCNMGLNNYKIFEDNRLCMGLSSSPYIFSKISDFVVRCLFRKGISRVVNYLDDFCILGGTRLEVEHSQRILIGVLRRLGFFINYKKVSCPNTTARFLGIIIDSVKLQLKLPLDKLEKMRCMLGEIVGKRKVTKKLLQRVGGVLSHCAKVIKGGRTFSRHIFDLMATLKQPHHRVRLNRGVMEDFRWWLDFANVFNGQATIINHDTMRISVYSDASDWGFGALYGSDWLVGAFSDVTSPNVWGIPDHHWVSPTNVLPNSHINIKEMAAIYEACARWAPYWQDSSLIFITDNTVVRSALNTGRSRNANVMFFLRRIFWLSVNYNFVFISTYIPSKVNVLCDALSRWPSPGMRMRICNIDIGRHLCCYHIFCSDSFCRSGSQGGAIGISRSSVLKEFEPNQKDPD